MEGTTKVKVAVRLRPMNETEKGLNTTPAVSGSCETKVVSVIKDTGLARSVFTFDDVFTGFSSQEEVFEGTLAPTIDDVMRGYEATVFAYGQTGTGKTYTMEGNLDNHADHGVIPRSTGAIFRALNNEEIISFRVACSYLEIYNEELCDLLVEDINEKPKLDIMNKQNGTFCRGLSEKEVTSTEDVLSLMRTAQASRKIGETKLNKHSSRSHCIFTVSVYTKQKLSEEEEVDYHGKLHLVDLAGSECAKNASLHKRSTSSEHARERERMNINRSLLTLGRVISTVKDNSSGKRHTRVPYRDSKLTRILQEALGGRSKTLIIATLSPSDLALSESISTLNYAQSACGIVNRPIASSFSMSPTNSARIKMSGRNSPATFDHPNSTVEHWFEMECRLKYLEAQVEEAQLALQRKASQQQTIIDRAEKAEKIARVRDKELNECSKRLDLMEKAFTVERKQKEELQRRLVMTEDSLMKTNAILKATQVTEETLKAQATMLISAVKKSVSESERMYQQLLANRESDVIRKSVTRDFHMTTAAILEDIVENLLELLEKERQFHVTIVNHVEDGSNQDLKSLDRSLEDIERATSYITELSNAVKKNLSMGDDGAKAILSEMMKSVGASLSCAEKKLTQDENEMSSSLTEMFENFNAYSIKMKSMSDTYEMRSSNALKELGTNSTDSTKMITDAVTVMVATTNSMTNASSQTRDELDVILSDLRGAYLESYKNIENKTKGQIETMSNTLQNFKVGMRHHDEVQNGLKDYDHFLTSKTESHSQTLSQQNDLLSLQQASFMEAKDKQQKLQKELFHNVLSGVQSLLKAEMIRLSKLHNEQLQSFKEINTKAADLNTSIGSITEEIVTESNERNESLNRHVEESRNNDVTMCDGVTESNEVFMELQDLTLSQHDLITKYGIDFNTKMSTLASYDIPLKEGLEKLKKEERHIHEHLSTVLVGGARGRLEELKEIEESQMGFNDTMITRTTNDLSAIQEKRAPVMQDISSRFKSLLNTAEGDRKTIDEIILNQCSVAQETKEKAEDELKHFQDKSFIRRKDEIEEQQMLLVGDIENHLQWTSEIRSTTLRKTKETEEQIGIFGTEVIKMKEAVPDVPVYKPVTYDGNLASTPHMSEIIKTLHIVSDSQDETRDDSPPTEASSDSRSQRSSGSDSHTIQRRLIRNENSAEIDVRQRKSQNVSRTRGKSLRA